jgi:hypothetical protein
VKLKASHNTPNILLLRLTFLSSCQFITWQTNNTETNNNEK